MALLTGGAHTFNLLKLQDTLHAQYIEFCLFPFTLHIHIEYKLKCLFKVGVLQLFASVRTHFFKPSGLFSKTLNTTKQFYTNYSHKTTDSFGKTKLSHQNIFISAPSKTVFSDHKHRQQKNY